MGSTSLSSKRKKKHSQKRGKKRSKSTREKSKKRIRRYDSDDSISCSAEDSVSAAALSLSCSGSDEKVRGRKRERSRDRKDRKGSKKRRKAKRSGSVSESSEGSPVEKKRKKLKKKSKDSDLKKRRSVKKKRRREASVSSLSSKSGDSGDDGERKPVREKQKVESKERKGRGKGKERGSSKRVRHSSRSRSPCSVHSEDHSGSYNSEDRVVEVNLPKRLKSVVVVVREREELEDTVVNRDGLKEQIVYDDDYPSRSNDSNEGVGKREAISPSDEYSSEKATALENTVNQRGAVTSNVKVSEISGTQGLNVGGGGGITASPHVSGFSDRLMDVTVNAGSSSGDLEAILRHKALENLLKRRGKLPVKVPADKNCNNNMNVELCSFENEQSLDRFTEEGSVKTMQKVGRTDDANLPNDLTEEKKLTLQSEPDVEKADGNVSSTSQQKSGRNVAVCVTANSPRAPEKSDTYSAEKQRIADNHATRRSKVGLPMSTIRLLGASNTWKREVAKQEPSQEARTAPKETVDKDSAKGTESLSPVATKVVSEKVSTLAASEPSASEGNCKKHEASEMDEDSEFQQKTMMVMRGGELVQVSYKVRIPKKAPALARRQLKR